MLGLVIPILAQAFFNICMCLFVANFAYGLSLLSIGVHGP